MSHRQVTLITPPASRWKVVAMPLYIWWSQRIWCLPVTTKKGALCISCPRVCLITSLASMAVFSLFVPGFFSITVPFMLVGTMLSALASRRRQPVKHRASRLIFFYCAAPRKTCRTACQSCVTLLNIVRHFTIYTLLLL